MFFVLMVLRTLLIFFEKYLSGIMGEIFSKNLRNQLFLHQLSTTMEEHEKKPVGKYLLRYSGDLSSIQNLLNTGILLFSCDFMFLSLMLWVLLSINVTLTLVLFSGLSIMFVLIMLTTKSYGTAVQNRRDQLSGNLAFVHSRLSTLISIKIFNKESIEYSKYEKRSQKLYCAGKRYQFIKSLVNAGIPLSIYMFLAFFLGYIYMIKTNGGSVAASTLLTYVILLLSTMPVLKRMFKINMVWKAGKVSFQKYLRVLNTVSERPENIIIEKRTAQSIVFDKVSFSYSDNLPLLKDVSFSIPERSMVRIYSNHGKGKSTVFKLILGIYSPQAGEIFLGQQSIEKISPQQLRRQITLISKDIPLVGDTIFEAISYSRKIEKRKSALEILKLLQFHKLGIEEIDLNYKIGENAKNLSASQLKLLTIARALLTSKKIILLDEPFIGLAPEIKNHLCAYFNSLKRTHTLLFIDQTMETNLEIDQNIYIQS